MILRRAACLLLFLLLAGSAAQAKMTWPDLLDRPRPKPDTTIAYGADPLQHVDLWLPKGAGPHPVVLMAHGGCWQTEVAKADIMNWIAADLRERGIAVWNVEYRGEDRPGGGYPGTFIDVGMAADALRASAAKYRLKADRVVAVGHSAGGHLALWLAARGGIAKSSALYSANPLKLAAAISLGGLPDLEAASVSPGDTCGADAVPELVGTPSPTHPDIYADTSPARIPAPGIPVTLVNGTVDNIAPPAFAEAYAARMRGAPKRVVIQNEGHVELITPDTKAWAATVAMIEAGLK